MDICCRKRNEIIDHCHTFGLWFVVNMACEHGRPPARRQSVIHISGLIAVGCFTLIFAYLHPPFMHEVAPLRGNKMQILSEPEFHALHACPHAAHAPHGRNLKSDKPETCRGSMVEVNQGPYV